jgi:hypothetical protein
MSALVKIDLTESGCRKPGCKHRFSRPNRHHKRHEKMFINHWATLPNPDSEIRRALNILRARYYQFRPCDTEIICEWHHVEIHKRYMGVIEWHKNLIGVRYLRNYSVRQAASLMRELKKEFQKWIKEKTPGINPAKARGRGEWG